MSISTSDYAQPMTFEVQLSAANITTTKQINIPIVRVGNKVRVMELTRITLEYSGGLQASADAQGANLSFRDFGTTVANLGDPSTWFKHQTSVTVVVEGSFTNTLVWHFDFTSGDGRGFLIATNAIFAQGTSNSLSGAISMRFKLWHRWVNITPTEYVALIAQQSEVR